MGRRGFESRLFTCQKLIQRNESQSIILDVDVLSTLTAGLIRCIYIDGLYQFVKDIGGKLLDANMLAGFLNKLLNVLNILSDSALPVSFKSPSSLDKRRYIATLIQQPSLR